MPHDNLNKDNDNLNKYNDPRGIRLICAVQACLRLSAYISAQPLPIARGNELL